MARPIKTGLEYFPLDVDMDQDDKLFFIEAKYGLIGFAIVVRMLMLIYKDGYYKHYSEDKEAFMLAKRLSVDVDVLKNVINDCINEGLFNKNLFEKYRILTSRGIQKRYLEACSRRKEVSIIKEYCLVDPKNYKNLVFDYINPDNVDINPVNSNTTSPETPQSKVKESKVKESKDDDDVVEGFQQIVDAFNKNIHPITPVEAEKLKAWLDDGMEPDVIIFAIEQAALAGNRTASYINGILLNLHTEGITTRAQAEARERDYVQRKMQGKKPQNDNQPRAPAPKVLTAEEKRRIQEANKLIAELSQRMVMPNE